MVEGAHAIRAQLAVINTLNTRLDAPLLAFGQMNHGGRAVVDHRPRIRAADGRGAAHPESRATAQPVVIDVCDSSTAARRAPRRMSTRRCSPQRDAGLRWKARGDGGTPSRSTNPGTTGDPEGRRDAPPRRLPQRASNVCKLGTMPHPVYLWTLPMFHCNGWCFPWTIAAMKSPARMPARRVDWRAIFAAMREHGVDTLRRAHRHNRMIARPDDARVASARRCGMVAGAACARPR